METLRIEILNPKALSLINDLAELKLIKINKEDTKSEFSGLLKKLRKNADNAPTFDEITDVVEEIRKSRYEKK